MIIDFPNEVDIALNYTKAPGYSQAGEEEREGGEREGGRETVRIPCKQDPGFKEVKGDMKTERCSTPFSETGPILLCRRSLPAK